jgi:hypothetical protein
MRLLALLFALCCSSAQAAWSFGPVEWTLTDLDRNDGIEAVFDTSAQMFDSGEMGGSGWETAYNAFLSPNTSITFSVLASVDTPQPGRSAASFAAWGNGDPFSTPWVICDTEGCQRSETPTITIDNRGREAMAVDYKTRYTFSEPSTAPVPEPETWALMLVGLFAVTRLARGRLLSKA